MGTKLKRSTAVVGEDGGCDNDDDDGNDDDGKKNSQVIEKFKKTKYGKR